MMNNSKSSNIVKLDDIDLIQISGVDSQQFLQNQLTSDINEPPSLSGTKSISKAGLSGYCTPQGRMMASFWISRSEINGIETFNIWISKDIAQSFYKKLRMFVLRSKVFIEYIPNKHSIFGYCGSPNDLESILKNKRDFNVSEISSVTYENRIYSRYLIATSAENTLNEYAAIEENVNLIFWNFLEIMSGIPRITAATQDKFVPQMINFESVHGIGFQKGCYPGQEIIARTQYRGTIKRRLFIYSTNEIINDYRPLPGDEIYDSQDLNQPAGLVVLSSLNTQKSKFYIQIELKIDSSSNELFAKKNDQFIPLHLQLETLPYNLINI